MSASKTNHLISLLDTWYPKRDELDWVLATIIETDGSSYRKPGAIMFINNLGQYFGLLSGGCLEADVMRQARKCWDTGSSHSVQYDMRDEDDIAWKLGIGCGGMVRILLQPVSADNGYLQLTQLRTQLTNNQVSYYLLRTNQKVPLNRCLAQLPEEHGYQLNHVNQVGDDSWFVSEQKPVIRLAIFGGGIDAIPLVNMAAQLGWHITVFDHRLGYARDSFFASANEIIRDKLESLQHHYALSQCSAVVIMNHNVAMDASALQLSQKSSASYIGMLGPFHRTERVFAEAGLSPDTLSRPLFNPVGYDLGGELPESIALSMLSEIHATLYQATGKTQTQTMAKANLVG